MAKARGSRVGQRSGGASSMHLLACHRDIEPQQAACCAATVKHGSMLLASRQAGLPPPGWAGTAGRCRRWDTLQSRWGWQRQCDDGKQDGRQATRYSCCIRPAWQARAQAARGAAGKQSRPSHLASAAVLPRLPDHRWRWCPAAQEMLGGWLSFKARQKQHDVPALP